MHAELSSNTSQGRYELQVIANCWQLSLGNNQQQQQLADLKEARAER